MFLSDAGVRTAKPKKKVYRLKDGDGLFLQVEPKGGKYWRFRYQFAGKEKLLALGTYPEVSLLEAREKRLAARRMVANGEDPGVKKRQDRRLAVYRNNTTFGGVAKEWFDTTRAKWTAEHAERLWRRLELHMIPEIGSLPIADIKAIEVLDALRKVEKRGTTETSHRLLQTCNAIFRYAVLTSRIHYNPIMDLKGALVPHRAEHHPTIEARELPGFFRALEIVRANRQTKIALLLTMMTFLRQGELRFAKWVDIDWEAKEWRVRAETTKMKRLHIVPLASQAIELLTELKDHSGHGEYLLLFLPAPILATACRKRGNRFGLCCLLFQIPQA